MFLFDDQRELFRSFHEGDEALRQEIIDEMNSNPGNAPSPLVLEGPRYRATGKVSNLRALPLCPGPDPFVRIIDREEAGDNNAKILAQAIERDSWSQLVVSGITRGMWMGRQLSMIEVAELLENFRYKAHDPDLALPSSDRWRAIASQLELRSPEAPLFRPPRQNPAFPVSVEPRYCPFSIAAYLRLWQSLLRRRARGIYPTDDPKTPWSMIDLRAYARSAPKFYIGLRFGGAGLSTHPRLAKYQISRVDRDARENVLRSTWGSRNPGEGNDAYYGDQLFDYHIHNDPVPRQIAGEPMWRPRGSSGLMLFHVIRDPSGAPDAVSVGICIPRGGPDHIAALRHVSG